MQAEMRRPRNCQCDGMGDPCITCLVGAAMGMRVQYSREILSVGFVRKKLPWLSGREAAIVLEAMRYTDFW